MRPTRNILGRTFCIRYGNSTATCFTIDVNNRQYIVTARHVVDSIPNQTTVQIWHENRWKELPVKLVGHGSNDMDITVLAPDRQLSPPHPLPKPPRISLGQDIQFLGFPYGLMTEVGHLNRGFPFALVKHGVLSALLEPRKRKNRILLLDGHNNPGFSGGPVICEIANSQSNRLAIIGVISSYKVARESIYQGQSETQFSYKDNTGIIYASDISCALDLIEKNPIGFKLPTP